MELWSTSKQSALTSSARSVCKHRGFVAARHWVLGSAAVNLTLQAAQRHTWRHHFKAEPELQVYENKAADTGEPFNQLLIKTNTYDMIVPFSPSCSCQSIQAALSFSSDRSRSFVLQQLQLRPFRAESVELKPQRRAGCLHRGPPSLSDRRSTSLEPLSIVPRRTRLQTPNSQSE
ncbi:hypothetical protein CRENBAI_022688 [Crenichthys baileyi]|uniref:Uncharacterized protein n=1 Tax=Crenichthys baileyi TaxID=28760 RepID=A0AAV9QVY8_9TELE